MCPNTALGGRIQRYGAEYNATRKIQGYPVPPPAAKWLSTAIFVIFGQMGNCPPPARGGKYYMRQTASDGQIPNRRFLRNYCTPEHVTCTKRKAR